MDLSPRQQALIEALLVERSKEAAAKAADVPPATMHRWFKTREFRDALRQAGEESLRHATAKLSRCCVAAADRLAREMDDGNPSAARIAAADKILSHAAKLADAIDARDELESLKAKIEELKARADPASVANPGA